MATTAPETENDTRVCKRCSTELPLADFVKATGASRHGRLYICKPCRRAERRTHAAEQRAAGKITSSTDRAAVAARREAYGWKYVDESPASPEIGFLGDMLAEDRRAGWAFAAVYDEDCRVALTVIDKPRDRELAAEILRWARPHFEAGWHREDVCRLDPGLIAAFAA